VNPILDRPSHLFFFPENEPDKLNVQGSRKAIEANAKEGETMNQDEFKRIITHAISQEVDAFTFYNAVSDRAKDVTLKSLFKDLAGEEEKHKRTLEGYLKKGSEKIHFSESADYKIVDALPTPQLTPDLKPVEGLVIAIKKELEAMQMYTQLAKASVDTAQKSIFLELASMERGHKSKLEDLYTNMAFPEVW
jgi:rubrerythrin